MAKKQQACSGCGGTGRKGNLVHSDCGGKGYFMVEDTTANKGAMPSERWGKW